MKSLRNRDLFPMRATPGRGPFDPAEVARLEVRRRLLRYILATHRRRLAHRGRGATDALVVTEG